MLCFTCTFSTCCLQYASVLQAGNIFEAINWLHFLYPPTKGKRSWQLSVITHTFTTTQNMELLYILCKSENYYLRLAALQPDSVLFTTVSVSHHKKKWLCCKNVIKYEVRSAIISDFTKHGMVILTTIVLPHP